MQKSGENVSDFIRRLEKKYQIAYGWDKLATATQDTLFYGQLYEGLHYEIMLSPAVSGSQDYKELATAAKAEERWLTELKQRKHYSKMASSSSFTSTTQPTTLANQPTSRTSANASDGPSSAKEPRKCYTCGELRHTALKCPTTKKQSTGWPTSARAKQICTQ